MKTVQFLSVLIHQTGASPLVVGADHPRVPIHQQVQRARQNHRNKTTKDVQGVEADPRSETTLTREVQHGKRVEAHHIKDQ